MEIRVGHRTYKTKYYERKGFWYISINDRETIYDEDNAWVTFETEEKAEEYLMQKFPALYARDRDDFNA